MQRKEIDFKIKKKKLPGAKFSAHSPPHSAGYS